MANALAELSKLTTDQLKELCDSSSNDRYDELVSQSDEIKSLESERELLMASVRSLAEFNLARQADYESSRAKLLTSVGDSNQIRENIQEKAAKLIELSKKTSLESTIEVVKAAKLKAEEESENIRNSFFNNSIDYNSFISEFTEKRKLAHLRQIKEERLRKETGLALNLARV